MKATTDTGTVELGTTEAGVTIGIVDFSRRTTDDFGVTTVTRRGFARRMAARIVLPFDEVDAVQRQLAALRATKARWTADERFAWLDFEGFYRDFEIDLALPPYSHCTLTVEGLVETETVEDDGGDPAPDGESSSLLLLHPVAIGDGELTDSSVPETDWPQWSAEATYDLGDRVIKTATHRIYESATDGNTGHDPEAATGEWIDVGPTNRWAMFDQALGTATTATGSIAVVIDPGAVGAVALLDVTGSTVRVQTTGYDKTKAAGPGAVTFLDLPGAGDPITVTVLGAGEVAVGTLLAGALLPLGSTEANPTAAITDYSRKEADDFGEIEVVERAWAKRMTARARIRTEAIDQVANRIAAVRATPALWIGKDGLDSLTIYGFFKDFSIETSEPLSTLNLQVEGLAKAAPIPPRTIEWVNVEDSDPSHPKPEDGATKGAPEGTEVAGRPAEDLVGQVDEHEDAIGVLDGAISAAQTAIADAQAQIETLLENYGDVSSEVGALETAMAAAQSAITTAQGQISSLLTGVGALETEIARVDVDAEAAVGQARGDLDRVSEALVSALADLSTQRAIMRDAGISVDPATGQVRLHAFDRSEERLNAVDIRLDAVDAEILLKASTTYVDQKITEAVLDPSQLAELEDIYARLGAAEISIDGLDAAVQLRATVVEVEGIEARVTTAESDIDALEGLVSTKVSTTEFDALETRVSTAETTLEAIDGAAITETLRTARLLSDAADENAAAAAMALFTGDAGHRTQVAAIAEIQRELTVKIVEDVAAEASARQALAVQLGAAEAAIASEAIARASEDAALASEIDTVSASLGSLSATVTTHTTALATLEGTVTSHGTTLSSLGSSVTTLGSTLSNLETDFASLESTVTAQGASIASNASAISTLEGDVSTLGTQYASLSSTVSTQGAAVSSNASAISALSDDVTQHAGALARLEVTAGRQAAEIDEAAIAAAQGILAADASARKDASARQELTAQVIEDRLAEATARQELAARLASAEASITSEAIARASEDAALASEIDTVSASLGSLSATVTTHTTALATLEGTVTSHGTTLSSLGSSVTTLGSTLSNLETDFASLESTVTAQGATVSTHATAISSLEGDVGSLESSVASLSSTVSAQGATISQHTTAISGMGGQWALSIDVDGRVVGRVKLDGTGQTSSFDVEADAFRITDPDGGAHTEYSDGNWRVYDASGVLRVRLGVW